MMSDQDQPPAGPELADVACSARLPKHIRDRIYKTACACKMTEEQAAKEPCACSAYCLVNDIEDWANDLSPNSGISNGSDALSPK